LEAGIRTSDVNPNRPDDAYPEHIDRASSASVADGPEAVALALDASASRASTADG
jgi:hypothetical protein